MPPKAVGYESKGFTEQSIIQDFPLRGKPVYLHIRRQKWLEKSTGKVITKVTTRRIWELKLLPSSQLSKKISIESNTVYIRTIVRMYGVEGDTFSRWYKQA